MTSKLMIRFIVAADRSYSKPGSVNRTFKRLDTLGTCANESTREMSVLLLENRMENFPTIGILGKERRSRFGGLDGKLYRKVI